MESTTTHPWHNIYPDGVPKEINPDKYESLLELLDQSFRKYENRIAFENFGKSISYRELDERSKDFAAWLQNSGMRKGDRIAIQLPNLLQFPIVMFGALRAGLVVVNTNPLYTPEEMKHQFRDSGARAIVILSNFASNLEKIIDETGIEKVIVTDLADAIGGLKGWIMNLVVKRFKKMVPKYNLPNHHTYKKVLKESRLMSYRKPAVHISDIAFLQYTGGTTGVSKGASLTHRNIISNMEQIFAWVQPLLREQAEVIITALPLYHIFALTVNCLAFFRVGGKNILITNPRDLPGFVKEMAKHKFTVFTGVNTLFNGLLNNEEFRNLDFSSLKLTMGGGMAVQEVVAKRWKEVTGGYLAEAYGLSETSPGVTANPLNENARIGSIGLPLPSTEVIIADDDGNPLEQGQRGEILVKGPQVMDGYWEKEEETRQVFVHGWLRTGDIGVMDPDGFFKIVDRKKEMILVSGFNVFPNEVEGVIAAHPKVLEVGVIGVPHEKSGEAVKACIVKKDDSLSAEEIIAFCRDKLTAYKVPKHISFLAELPKSNVGKILRRKLKELEKS